jgi:hypothetical protein
MISLMCSINYQQNTMPENGDVKRRPEAGFVLCLIAAQVLIWQRAKVYRELMR